MHAIKFASDATIVAVAVASTATPIPNDSTGNPAKEVYVISDADIYIMPRVAGGTVTLANGVLLRSGQALRLDVSGYAVIANIGAAGTETLCIAPIENR